jgi:hypothetical protein
MKERGTIYSIGEIEDITTKSGRTMSKQQVVVEFLDNTYLRRVAMYAVTDGAIDAIARMEVGDTVDVVYSVSSREWKDRWYTDVTLLRIDDVRDAYTRMHQQQPATSGTAVATPETKAARREGIEDLPF